MKKISISILVILFFFSSFIYNKYYGIINSGKLPNFKYENVNGLLIEKKHLNPYKKTVIIYFSTECISCKNQFMYDKIFTLKKKYNIIYITSENNVTKVKKFINYNKLKNENITLLIDKKNKFASDFKIGLYYQYPMFITYEKKGKDKKIIEDISVLF
jgi:hypothetical protein